MQGLNQVVALALGEQHHHHHRNGPNKGDQNASVGMEVSACVCDGGDVVANIKLVERMEKERAELRELEKVAQELGIFTWGPSLAEKTSPELERNTTESCSKPEDDLEAKEHAPPKNSSSSTDESTDHKLATMGINTAVAIALHNFPEGLATFVAALADLKVGFVLAIAIAIHNIPEGLCVALPIYYASQNKRKAFLWALLSGLSEPLAALLGWVFLSNIVTDKAYAALFGIVAGMMVIISIRELLPTAFRYDPDDKVITMSFIVGMAFISLSLVLFQL